MALDDIGSNCTLTAANRDNSLETVKQVKLNGSSELYKVQIGIPVLEQFPEVHKRPGACTNVVVTIVTLLETAEILNLFSKSALLIFTRRSRNTTY